MRRLQPIVWTKGTLLTPQHLQQQDAYIEGTAQFNLHALTFRPWGFRSLVIDREALAGGYLALSAAAGMFADGLIFDCPDSDAAPEPRALADCFSPQIDTLDFFLAIPHAKDRGVNVGADEAARYRPRIELVRDEIDGVTERPVQLARKNLRIISGMENREGLSIMPIARITRTPAATFALDGGFVPPLLDIGASPYLRTVVRRLVEILTARSTALAAALGDKGGLAAREFTAADIPNFWLLYTINSWLPVFRHLHETQRGHPEALFSAMTAMAGTLTAFSTDVQPASFPSYDHENPGPCLTQLDAALRSLLESAVPRNFVSLPLKLVQPSIYAVSLDNDRYLASSRMYLAIRSETNPAELIAKAPRLVKVASVNTVEHLVRQALPGIGLTHLPLPPGALPVKLNFQYFSLDQVGPAWESIVRSRSLAAYVPAEFPGAELELIILLSSEN